MVALKTGHQGKLFGTKQKFGTYKLCDNWQVSYVAQSIYEIVNLWFKAL